MKRKEQNSKQTCKMLTWFNVLKVSNVAVDIVVVI